MCSNGVRFFDIGTNLMDEMYDGIYHGKKVHESDLTSVLERAEKNNVDKMVVICGTLNECQSAIEKFSTFDNIYLTIGCHPTRCNQLETISSEDDYFDNVKTLIQSYPNKIIAYGEIGLDYDRTHFCDKETQKKWFRKQLDHAILLNLPLYFHMRNAADDFISIIDLYQDSTLPTCVAHCFTGTLDEAIRLIQRGFFIGLTGISFKTEENCNMIKSIPLSNIVVETDCPWCEFKKTNFGYNTIKTHYPSVKKEKWIQGSFTKSRQEPSHVIQVVEAISKLKSIEFNHVATAVYQNALKLFRLL